MLYLVIFIIITLIVLTLYIVKVNVVIDYKLSNLDDWGIVSFSLFGGRLKRNIKLPGDENKRAKEGAEAEDWTKGIYDKIQNIREIYRVISKIRIYLGRKIVLKILRLNVHIGTGDACETGILSGLAWTAAGAAASFVFNTFRQAQNFDSSVIVKPYFVEKKFIAELYCIFDIKFVHIMIVVLKYRIFKRKKEENKGGMK